MRVIRIHGIGGQCQELGQFVMHITGIASQSDRSLDSKPVTPFDSCLPMVSVA